MSPKVFLSRWLDDVPSCAADSKNFLGIRNTTTVFDGPQRDRVRIPRHVSSDGILRVRPTLIVSLAKSGLDQLMPQPYSQREALGQAWLKDLESGRYREEYYVAHLGTHCTLLAHRIFTSNPGFLTCRVAWTRYCSLVDNIAYPFLLLNTAAHRMGHALLSIARRHYRGHRYSFQ